MSIVPFDLKRKKYKRFVHCKPARTPYVIVFFHSHQSDEISEAAIAVRANTPEITADEIISRLLALINRFI